MASKKKLLQAAAGSAGGAGLDVDEVFSTFLYTGTGSGQTFNNGIDLSGEGGLVWIKNRDTTDPNMLVDTERGASNGSSARTLQSNSSSSAFVYNDVTAFNSNGFTTGGSDQVSTSGEDFVSWTFRKAPKFFDVVTYSGQNTDLALSHNLGVAPGMVIVKRTDTSGDWYVYHRSLNLSENLSLNSIGDVGGNNFWTSSAPSSTVFNIDGNRAAINQSGGSYVAYLFAHNNNDGEFGPDSDQDVIKCGSYTGNGSTEVSINLGWEPQFVIIKNINDTSNDSVKCAWNIIDTMRGWTADGVADYVSSNDADAESQLATITPKATGFTVSSPNTGDTGDTYIYMAIRRGPLAEPTSASDVFAISTFGQGGSSAPAYTSNFPVDMYFERPINTSFHTAISSRLTAPKYMKTNTNGAEVTDSGLKYDFMDGVYNSTGTLTNYYAWMWKRAPGYFDVVAYTGDGGASTLQNHNLGVVPEMIWIKRRDSTENWGAYHKALPSLGKQLYLNLNGSYTAGYGSHIAPTATQFCVGGNAVMGGTNATNASGGTFIAYLFATVAGVSKVGSATGASSDVTVDCGFSNGAKFVIIKDASATDDWYVYDTARGIVAGNDGYLELNTTNAENTGADYIDPHSSGFIITSGFMQSGRTYIFYAIAA